MRRTLFLDGEELTVEAKPDDDGARLRIRGEAIEGGASAFPLPGGWSIRRGQRTLETGVSTDAKGNLIVQIEGETFRFTTNRPTGQQQSSGSEAGDQRAEVRTPMPGRVVRVLKGEGEAVEAGEGVVVFEAMKMQNEIAAPRSGVVANMMGSAGTPLEGGELLFAVEPAPSP